MTNTNPDPTHPLRPGDRLLVLAERENLVALKNLLESTDPRH